MIVAHHSYEVIAAKVLKLFTRRGPVSKAIDFHPTDREVEILKLLADGFSCAEEPRSQFRRTRTPRECCTRNREYVGGLTRSVYTRSSVSTHTPTERIEITRVHAWVWVVLCELLELPL